MTISMHIIRGLPGSGKSTLAKKIAACTNALHVEADMFFMKSGSYVYVPEHAKIAHEWCRGEVAEALARGQSVVVSNTFTRKWEMRPYIDLADKFGAALFITEAMNNFGNIHNVPQSVLDDMAKRWEAI